MSQQRVRSTNSRISATTASSPPQPMEPGAAYEALMGAVRGRLLVLDVDVEGEGLLNRAERFALHIRKIVEAIAFAALSALEYKNASQLKQQRTQDASQILAWLKKKGMLRLPAAQRVTPSTDPQFSTVCEGNSSADLGAEDLQRMFSRSSALIHERHPERLSQECLKNELQELEKDARQLRHWLWNHIIFLGGESFFVQMGMFGTPSFLKVLTRAPQPI